MLFFLIPLLILNVSTTPIMSVITQHSWKEGDVNTWESLLTVFSNRISPNNRLDSSTTYSKTVERWLVENDNTSSKMVTLSTNQRGLPYKYSYDYSAIVVTGNLASLVLPFPQQIETNKSVFTSIATGPYPPYYSEFDPMDFKNQLNVFWGFNQTGMLRYWNGSQSILFTVGEFLSMVDSIKFMGKDNMQDGINQIKPNTRVFSLEIDLSSAFKLPSIDYSQYNVSVEKRLFKYEFGITTGGLRDFVRTTNYYFRNASEDGYGIEYNYTYYQKLNSVNFEFSYTTGNLTSVYAMIIGIATGFILFPVLIEVKKYYEKKRKENT